MPLQKQNLAINFAQGLDTKTDPFQVSPGKMLALQNAIFTKGGLLQKRNGYQNLTALPDASSTYLTTFGGGLTAVGNTLYAYSQGSETWLNKGTLRPVHVNAFPTVRTANSQSQADSVVAANGLVCTAFTDQVPSGGSTTPVPKYAISDSITGQTVVAPTAITSPGATPLNSPRVFLVGNYFVVVFQANVSSTPHLQFIAINASNPSIVTDAQDISTTFTPATTGAFDGVVANNNLFIAYNGSDGGGAIRITIIDSTLALHNTIVFSGKSCTFMSMSADTSSGSAVVYAAFSTASAGYVLAVSQQLNTVLAPTQIISAGTVANITCYATGGTCTVFYEKANTYGYDSTATNFINKVAVTQAGTVGSTSTILRSVGLGSKAFSVNGVTYMLTSYSSTFQPTYFLIDSNGNVMAKLAYSNGGGYCTTGLPGVTVSGTTAYTAYLYKDLIQGVNKSQGVANSAGVYSQTGVNLAQINLAPNSFSTAEVGGNLHLSGGFLWMYDGSIPVEHNFHLWCDNPKLTGSTTGGTMTAQQYFYVVTYEWTDFAGNIHRSAPSVPISVTTTGTTSSVTVHIPTLRLTYKATNIRLTVYRWSQGQQTYFQVTPVQSPVLNSTTSDSVDFVDTQPDTAILGNAILYTTGGVVEDIASPATNLMTLYKSRLFLVDAEDPNLLWFSKQVIESTPVEMSDLFTMYIAPTTSAQGNTGPITAISALDDKLIIFKKNAIYYVTGTGPDNTGANNDFSEPIFITSTVGCSNQNSIVFMPSGLMFQSDKGIWLLGRDLSTTYIGAPVEQYNPATVQSAINVPGTNQVRLTLNNSITLMYDYFYGQWGTFVNLPAISSTLFDNLHTYVNQFGQVFQENPGTYLDGSNPVLMSFTTSWFNLAGLQGYERAYRFYMLGTYISPHKINVQIAYDYNPSPTQTNLIAPDNYTPTYGGDPLYGSSEFYGGYSTVEQWAVSFQQQKCQAFQLTLTEIYDSSFGVAAGAGFTLSGLNLIVGAKSSYPRLKPSREVG